MTKASWCRATVSSCLFVVGMLACSSRDNPEEKRAKSEERLTQSELARILSFEGVLGAGGDWVNTGGTVASSTLHASAGAHSMVMSGAYSISMTSTALSALGSVGSKMSLDIWLPSSLAGQPNKGNIQAFFDSPSLNLHAYATTNVALASLTPGQFSRIDIPLDSTLSTQLSKSGYSDLIIKFTFNFANTMQTFVDNIAFGAGSTGAGGSTGTGGAPAIGGAGGASINSGGAPGVGGSQTIGGAPVTAGGSGTRDSTAIGGVTASGGTASGGLSSTSNSNIGGGGGTAGTSGPGGTSGTGAGTSYTFLFQLPAGVTRNQVLFATTSGDLNIEDGVNAYDGTGFASVSSADQGMVNRIGVGSQVQNVWSDGDVTLANNALVHGALWTSGELFTQSGAQVLGSTTEMAVLTPFQTVSWNVDLPPNSRPAVSITAAQSLNPGNYPEYGVKTGGQLNLSSGTYTFSAMMIEPGAALDIDNRQGPVFIYLREGFTFRGTVTRSASKANVLFGIAGTSPVVIDSAFTGIIVAPQTSITLATVSTQHKGAFFAQSIIARRNTTIVLDALDSANLCTASDACSSFCPCAPGASKTCADNSACQSGSVCGSGNGAAFGLPSGANVCWPAMCQLTGGIGSGCSRFPQGCQACAFLTIAISRCSSYRCLAERYLASSNRSPLGGKGSFYFLVRCLVSSLRSS